MAMARGSDLQKGAPFRLGRLSFVNVLPVYLFLRQDGALFREVCAPPSTLNRMLREALLEVSPVSSVEYARGSASYSILKGLSISSLGRVRSVMLFSQKPMEKWRGGFIECPMESETSVFLLKLLLRNHWGLDAELAKEGRAGEPSAVLRIGDRALREAASGKWPHAWDLGEAWFQWTGLPFVFALWLVREEVARDRAAQLRRLHKALLRAKETGLCRIEACVEEANKKLGGLKLDLLEYFQGLNFDLGEAQIRGLSRFFEELGKAGLIRENPLLRLWPA